VPGHPPSPTLVPYTTLFRSCERPGDLELLQLSIGEVAGNFIRPVHEADPFEQFQRGGPCRTVLPPRTRQAEQIGRQSRALRPMPDRKSTRLNSSHVNISYAV